MADAKDIMGAIRDDIKADSTLNKWAKTLVNGDGTITYVIGRQEVDPGLRPCVWIVDDPEWEFGERELNDNDREILQNFSARIMMPPETANDDAETFKDHIIRIINADDTLGGIIWDITPIAVYETEGSEPCEDVVIMFATRRS